MSEEAKRLEPKKGTLRELFLKSGNQCAYPDCTHLMMDDDGVFIGQLCHIEAARPNGERFNKDQENEDRRHFNNLMLMCYEHHQITNNVEKYPVERLKKIKATHEEKYTNVEDKIFKSITDKTKEVKALPHTNLIRINESLDWNLKGEELEEVTNHIKDFIDILVKIPENSRRVYTIMVERHTTSRMDHVVNPEELEEAAHLSSKEVQKHIRILERYGLTSSWYMNFDDVPEVRINNINDWDISIQLFDFCKKEKIDPTKLFVQLNFSLLG